MRALSAGFASGVLATLPMSAVMWSAQRAGLLGRMPPAKITDAASRAVRHRPPRGRARKIAAAALHLGFGGVAGAAYAWWAARGRGRRGPAQGAAFGTLVWLGSYAGWVPALGIMPPPERDRPGRPSSMILAHWVYGAALGAQLRALAP
jgi:hypothetical protein